MEKGMINNDYYEMEMVNIECWGNREVGRNGFTAVLHGGGETLKIEVRPQTAKFIKEVEDNPNINVSLVENCLPVNISITDVRNHKYIASITEKCGTEHVASADAALVHAEVYGIPIFVHRRVVDSYRQARLATSCLTHMLLHRTAAA
jgi:hypothetical protein